MERDRDEKRGFFLSLIFCFLFRMGWLAFIIALLILHFTLGWPLWLIIIPIGIWVVHSLIATLILRWGSKCSREPKPERENKNPYSARTSDLFKTK